MPFGLTNAPTSLLNLVHDIFQDPLDVYVVVYLDDNMVFSKSEEEHVTHVSPVPSRLRANSLFDKASKCLFHSSSVGYLGYVVSYEGLKMNQAKVQQIINWPPPRNLKALQSFLCFANFYNCFIKNYSKKISSLTSFLKKDSSFPFNEEALKTDASNYALGAVLSQVSDSGKHPIAFNSRKPLPAELNYEIHDKDLLGINIFSKHGLSSSIVSDRGPLFGSSFWTNLCHQLKVSRDLSTAYHPEADGQTERVNQILEQYLWMYVSYHKDNWNNWLSLAEFDYNNSDHSSTKQLPFFTVYGRDPQFDSVHITQDNPAGTLSRKIQSVQQDLKEELEAVINRLKRYADESRAGSPDINPGDMVWLSSRNIK
ncbi:hypothetical protein O181_110990 [Austropuccinia psidii MF-1]|uniref:Integrase catalytic domain-containing protein n=1 Tax=Austropuccinia psidii MF-1 TaxID=1389203 RepID=A0A9Q3JXJ0_9BASI|nr:hypothetical protein [Austropuccinia psidii MF-1]